MVLSEHITKSYTKGDIVLKDLSFRINPSEIFGFIGPDGAGKTTLFRIMASLLLPDSGSLIIDDHDVIKDYKYIRRITGYMPGQFSLYSDLTVVENLNFFASVFGTTIKENYDLIKDIYIQIEPFKDRRAGKLSGGMKQKLALSCALIHYPKILILDEPTTGVDAVSRNEFWDLLKGLKDKGITIVVSTPYMDEALQCDRVALMQDGTVLKIDKPEQIISQQTYSIYSISAKNTYKLINDLRNYSNTKHAYAFGQSVHYTDQRNNFNTNMIESYLLNKGTEDLEIEKIKPGIEDVFIDLMQKNRNR